MMPLWHNATVSVQISIFFLIKVFLGPIYYLFAYVAIAIRFLIGQFVNQLLL